MKLTAENNFWFVSKKQKQLAPHRNLKYRSFASTNQAVYSLFSLPISHMPHSSDWTCDAWKTPLSSLNARTDSNTSPTHAFESLLSLKSETEDLCIHHEAIITRKYRHHWLYTERASKLLLIKYVDMRLRANFPREFSHMVSHYVSFPPLPSTFGHAGKTQGQLLTPVYMNANDMQLILTPVHINANDMQLILVINRVSLSH